MPKQRLHVFIAFVLVLLIIAGLCALLTNGSKDKVPKETPEPVESAEPEESSSPADEPSAKPEETPGPTETPEPEPSLDPSVPVTRQLNLSGDFASSTGTNLNIGVKWTAESKNDETIKLTVTSYVYSYAMHCGPVSGTMSVNGQSESFSSGTMSYDSTEKLQAVKLHTMTLYLPISVGETVSIPVSVSWNFDGEYNGQQFDGITVEQYIEIAG